MLAGALPAMIESLGDYFAGACVCTDVVLGMTLGIPLGDKIAMRLLLDVVVWCVRACVRVCVRACVRACVRVRVRASPLSPIKIPLLYRDYGYEPSIVTNIY